MQRVAGGVVLGLGAGFVGGLFGVGGGVVMVPGMVLLLGFEQHRAHATSVAAIVAAASAGVAPFALDGEVAWATAGFLLIGALAGAVIGARNIARIPAVWLARAFVVVALVSAVRMWFSA